MNIVISLLIGLVTGGIIGFAIAGLLTASGRYDDRAALAEALANTEAENTLLRRRNSQLLDEIATMAISLDAARDRDQLLADMAREMNQ